MESELEQEIRKAFPDNDIRFETVIDDDTFAPFLNIIVDGTIATQLPLESTQDKIAFYGESIIEEYILSRIIENIKKVRK